jgi:flagellar biosynthetic protein FliQ
MNPQDAIDFSREAIKACLMVGGPILVASLVIGLLIGVLQAMTQVQDQTVSFVPKILLLIVMIGMCLPWLTDKMMDFAKLSFEKPMTQWAENSSSSGRALFTRQPDDSFTNQSTASVTPPDSTPARFASLAITHAKDFGKLTTQPSTVDRLAPRLATARIPVVNPEPSSQADATPLPIELSTPDEFEVQQTPTKSPFILPHYRMIKADKADIEG